MPAPYVLAADVIGTCVFSLTSWAIKHVPAYPAPAFSIVIPHLHRSKISGHWNWTVTDQHPSHYDRFTLEEWFPSSHAQETAQVPEPVRTFRRTEYLSPTGNQTPNRPARNPSTTLTTLHNNSILLPSPPPIHSFRLVRLKVTRCNPQYWSAETSVNPNFHL